MTAPGAEVREHPCCKCCPADDPAYHLENPEGGHDISCSDCDRERAIRAGGYISEAEVVAREQAAVEKALAPIRAAIEGNRGSIELQRRDLNAGRWVDHLGDLLALETIAAALPSPADGAPALTGSGDHT